MLPTLGRRPEYINPQVTITWKNQPLANGTKVIVGQKVTLSTVEEGDGGAPVRSRKWGFEGNVPIGGYEWSEDQTHTSFTQVSTDAKETSVYWTSDGHFLPIVNYYEGGRIQHTVTYENGSSITATTYVLAVKPDVDIVDARYSDYGPDQETIHFERILGLDWVLSLGLMGVSESSQDPGFRISAVVNKPNGAGGQLAFVQLTRSNRVATSNGVTGTILTTNGLYFLDGSAPYGGTSGTYPMTSDKTIATLADLPQQAGITDALSSLSVTDDFAAYLMYKPDFEGSIWVTLREIDWGWSAKLAQPPGGWSGAGLIRPLEPLRGPIVINTSNLPTWNFMVAKK